MLRTIALLTAAPVMLGAAAAQEFTPYLEVGPGFALEQNFDTVGVTARGGVRTPMRDVIDALAFEGELFYGLDGEDTGQVEAKIEYSLSASVRPIIEVAPNFDLFARAGIDISKAEVEGQGFFAGGAEDTEVGLLVGAGGEFRLTPRTGLRFDYSHRNDYDMVQATYAVRF